MGALFLQEELFKLGEYPSSAAKFTLLRNNCEPLQLSDYLRPCDSHQNLAEIEKKARNHEVFPALLKC